MKNNNINPNLYSEVKKLGARDLEACMQCGNCASACPLSAGENTFPRRIYRYLQLGLTDKLLESPEPWLCYYCGDCNTDCPRGAEPAETMMATRRWLMTQYDWTGLARIFYSSPKAEVGAFLGIALFVITLFLMFHGDVVTELMGKEELLEDYLKPYPEKVRTLQVNFSRLFGDIIRFSEEYLFRERELELIDSIVDSIFYGMRDSVLIMRPDLRIVDANQAFLQLYGLSKDEVIGKFCYEIVHRSSSPCEEGREHCPVRQTLETGEAAYAIHEHINGDNQSRHYEVTTLPLMANRGKPHLILKVDRDITEELEKRVEQKTRAFKQDIARIIHEDKMIALGKLVASAVHEINNPISGIHMLAHLMHKELTEVELTEEKKEEFRRYLQLIDTESARCGGIIGNLLSFSRQQKVIRKDFDLNELIRKVITLSGYKIGMQNINLQIDLYEKLPLVKGDPGQIQQCLLNLIFNSMEAMPRGGELRIRTAWDAQRSEIRLEVEDTGEGIPHEIISNIFEPFFTTKGQDKGVGLGLSVVYGIIKEHGGSIFVKSSVGEGAQFIIRLPAGDGNI